MSTHNEIYDRIKSIIPINLWNKYGSESFEEMANEPELEQWRNELLQAEADWWSVV